MLVLLLRLRELVDSPCRALLLLPSPSLCSSSVPAATSSARAVRCANSSAVGKSAPVRSNQSVSEEAVRAFMTASASSSSSSSEAKAPRPPQPGV